MKNHEHRPGVSEANLMVRHLKLERLHLENINQAILDINNLYGVDSVSFDEKKQVLSMAYDAFLLSIDDMEVILRNHDLDISHDWWSHFKEDYYRFVDQNIKDNAKRDPWSCHQTPPKKIITQTRGN